jgi:hypothetical protein
MTRNKLFRLHVFPLPEGRFGREEAQDYIEREFRRQANAAHSL